MAKRRIQEPQPQATAMIYENGEEAYEDMLINGMGPGLPGGFAKNVGANRWQTNITISIRDVFGPLPNPNLFVYPRNRWRNYLQNYVGPDGINGLRDAMRYGIAGQGDAFFYTHTKEHHQGMKAHNEKGNCFVGISFRSNPFPAVTMHSRTVTLTPMGLLDIAFGILLAREWWYILNTSTPPTFNWHTSSMCITPFHSTIILGKMGLFDTVFYPNEETLRSDKDYDRYGEHWPGRHEVYDLEGLKEKYLPDYKMLFDSIRMANKFISSDDYDRDSDNPDRVVYAQYVRMQRKLRLWLWNQERIKPWIPWLPSYWFEDMYRMSKAVAKNRKKFPLTDVTVPLEDYPRGLEFEVANNLTINEAYRNETTLDVNWKDLLDEE